MKRKSYRESLQNNRAQILLSKELVTIKCDVEIELEVEKMHAGEPDIDVLRNLFTELEFTSLLKELLPVVEAPEGNYREAKSAEEVKQLLKSRAKDVPLSVAVSAALEVPDTENEAEGEEDLLPLTMNMTSVADKSARATQMAVSVESGSAVTVSSESQAGAALNDALADPQVPKAIHDWKTAAHGLEETALAGVLHDTRLYSYLLDPTYSSHSLPEVALRRFNMKLGGSLAEAADLTGRLASTLRQEVEQENLRKLYQEIDLPLVPVLTRMEQAGVAIDRAALANMSLSLIHISEPTRH